MSSVAVHPIRITRRSLLSAWRSWLLVASSDDSPVGTLALQQRRTMLVPGPRFDPVSVAPSIFGVDQRDLREYLFIGGGSDLAAGVATAAHLSHAQRQRVRRALIGRAFAEADARGLCPVALYVRTEEIDDFVSVRGQRVSIGKLSVLRVQEDDQTYLDSLTSNSRRTVRQDRERIARHALVSEVRPALDVLEVAADLVVNVKRRHGVRDHPKLARLRLSEWAAESIGERVAFVVSDARRVLAVAFGVVSREHLEVHETGLVEDHELRHDAYVQSLIYAPLEYARAVGAPSVELGLDSPTPKTRRGAVLTDVWAAG